MRRLLHELWPLAAVVALTVVLALQIPRKALFFAPQPVRAVTPFASFVEYAPEVYDRLVQQVRMSWQVRAQGVDPGADSRVDELGGEEELPLPAELALPAAFVAAAPAVLPMSGAASLRPPSVADDEPPTPVPVAPDDDAEARALRADLIRLPASLQETTP